MSTPSAEDALTAEVATSTVGTVAAGGPAPLTVSVVVSEGRSSTPASRAPRSASTPTAAALRTLALLAIVAAFVGAREVLVPVALGAFVAFLLAPIASALERLRVPRGLAATLSVLTLAVAALGVLWMSGAQAVDFARRLPEYKRTLDAKLAGFRSAGVGSPISEAADRLHELKGRLTSAPSDAPAPAPAAASGVVPAPAPDVLAVRVVEDAPTPLDVYGDLVGSVLGPLGIAAVVVLLAIFLLTYRTDVRERLLALGSAHRIGVTSQALAEAGRRVARYLLSNLAVNVLYGLLVGVGVAIIGVPNAALWGLLCALLRFVPYVGTWIGAAFPLAVSVAVFDGWGHALATFLTILGIDVVVGNVVEPLVYGHRTGLSPLAVVLATIFWTWVWGVPGLLLAIPMTLCLAVAGRYIPGFGALHVLLGDEQVLDPAERAYERLIAFDAAAAGRVAAEVRAQVGPAAADDAVLLGVLRRAERDRREGQLDEERYLAICDGVREAFDDADVEVAATPPAGAHPVLCLPAFAESDRVACEMLVRHLTTLGLAAEVGPTATTVAGPLLDATRAREAVVCVVALPPFAALRVRYGLRRVRSHVPGVRLVGVVLDPDANVARVESALHQAGAMDTTFSLAATVRVLGPRATPDDPPGRLDGGGPAPVPAPRAVSVGSVS